MRKGKPAPGREILNAGCVMAVQSFLCGVGLGSDVFFYEWGGLCGGEGCTEEGRCRCRRLAGG